MGFLLSVTVFFSFIISIPLFFKDSYLIADRFPFVLRQFCNQLLNYFYGGSCKFPPRYPAAGSSQRRGQLSVSPACYDFQWFPGHSVPYIRRV